MDNTHTITDLENLKNELLQRVEHIDNTISTLKSLSFSLTGSNEHVNGNSKPVNAEKGKYADFDRSATIRSKVAYVLKKENRFLRVREIAQILNSLEPQVSIKEFIDKKLSAAITYLKNEGKIIKIIVGKANANTFWGSKNWLDEHGNIKEEHKYDEKQLSNNDKEEIEI